MTRIGLKGNFVSVLRVSTYYEEGGFKHWYLIPELNVSRKTLKSATKIANKHLKTLKPTEEWIKEQKRLKKENETDEERKLRKKKKKKDKKKNKKQSKKFKLGINNKK